MRSARTTFLLLSLAMACPGCRAPLSSGATSQSYVRLLDTDPLQSLASMRQAADGNLLFLYTAQVPGDSVTSIELTKTDPDGNVLWTKQYGGSGNYQSGDCLSLADGTIAIAGTHQESTGDQIAAYIVDQNGLVLHSHEFEFLQNLVVGTLSLTDDGNLLVGCMNHDPTNTGKPNSELTVLLLSDHLDSIMDFTLNTWTVSTFQPIQYQIHGMSSLTGGTGIAAGTYNFAGVFPKSALYSWLSPDSIGGVGQLSTAGNFTNIVRTGDATYVIAGDSTGYSTNSVPWFGEIDQPTWGTTTTPSTLVPIWSRTLTLSASGSITGFIQTRDGGFAGTGYAAAPGDTSIFVFRTDAKGNTLWPLRTYSFNGGDVPNAIIELPNGDLIIGGTTTSFGGRAGTKQIFLIHLKPDGTPAS